MVRNQQHCEGCFFAFNEQVRGRSGEALVSAQILPIMWARVWLFLSTTPLLQGDSAAVGCTIIPRWSAISKNSLLANSPPLSVRNFWGLPLTAIHIQKMCLMMVSLFLFGMNAAADRWVHKSIKWRMFCP